MKADMRSFSEMVDDDPAGAPYVVRHSVLAPKLCRAVIAEATDPRPALGFGGQPHPDGFTIGIEGSDSELHAEVHDIVTGFAQAANDALWNFDAPTTHGWCSQGYGPVRSLAGTSIATPATRIASCRSWSCCRTRPSSTAAGSSSASASNPTRSTYVRERSSSSPRGTCTASHQSPPGNGGASSCGSTDLHGGNQAPARTPLVAS